MSRTGLIVAALLVAAGSALAQDQIISVITLKSGEVVRGVISASDDTTVTITSATLGALKLPREQIATITDAAKPPAEAPAPPKAPVPAPAHKPADAWKWDAALGVNGSEGNTRNFNFRGELAGKAHHRKMETTAKVGYILTRDRSNTTKNRFETNIRNDWKLQKPWRLFAQAGYENEQFQPWDNRLTAYAGVGYEIIANEKTTLIGRVGAGVQKTWGGRAENALTPEGVLGLDFNHKIKEGHDLFANVDYYPSLKDLGPYRVVAKAGYNILLDAQSKMTLKLGVEDRYDSEANRAGKRKNDLDYFAMLGWSF